MPRMAAWGKLMMGAKCPPPTAPALVMVNVPALKFFQAGLSLTRPRHQNLKINGQLPDTLAVHIAQDRYDQAPGGIHGNAHMEVLLVDDLFARHVPGWH